MGLITNRRVRGFAVPLAALGIVALGIAPAPAAAEQTTLGVATPAATGSGGGCVSTSSCTLVQTALASGVVAAPAAGRITSWWAVSSTGTAAHLRVLRPEPLMGPRTFTALATSSQQTLGATATHFPTDLPVGLGNVIGVTMAPNGVIDEQANASSNVELFADALADGSTETSLAEDKETLELGAQFFYTPVLSAVGTSSGSTVGGEIVVIRGAHLSDSTAVRFGSAPATSFTIDSNAQITATAPAAPPGVVNVTVAGPGGTSAIVGSGKYTFVAPTATVTPAIVDFGSQRVGSPSSVQPVKLSNTGTVPVAIGAVTLGGAGAGDYTELSDGCAGHAVAPGTACSVSLVFTPSALGPRNATLRVDDDANDGPHTVILTGHGITSSRKPSNHFALSIPKLNRNRGTATLVATIPGPGTLVLTGKGLNKQTRIAAGAGKVKLVVTPTKRTRRRLTRTGTAKIVAGITYTPTGGNPNAKSKPLVLKLTHPSG